MEMLVIAVVALVAFAAVLVPLFRRRPGIGDDLEFENTGTEPTPPPDATAQPPQQAPDDELEREVLRYRDAVRAGTVCPKCGQANPVDSSYCYECGARLPRADAQEFE